MHPLKIIFALEYVLQGLANPFQGITYQPFFKHFHVDYGVSEAGTQDYFARSYLAWSFKPILGFLLDAWGKTRLALILLLGIATVGYALTPLVDRNQDLFFWYMFVLSVFLAATDVAVDRATVVAGDEEASATGKSKSTTVGLNQAICWAAIYGTSVVAAIGGGLVAQYADFNRFILLLALVPLVVLVVAFTLPKDTAPTVSLRTSVRNFWDGLNTGPVLWIVVFYFVFHFQPAMGALWTNHLIDNLKFDQEQVGYADGASNMGLFVGVLVFAKWGVRWQDALGLRQVFKICIVLNVLVSLTTYLQVDPWFSAISRAIALATGLEEATARLAWLSSYNLVQQVFVGFTRMCTFSLVGAVIPSRAAGSLFAGFMSVANIAYSFSYSSGAWLYDHGLEYAPVRELQAALFGIPGSAGQHLSISMLILIGSLAYFLSFLATHRLPDRRQTAATGDLAEYLLGPKQHASLGATTLRRVNVAASAMFALAWGLQFYVANWDFITSTLVSFFCTAFLRKVTLDALYKREVGARPQATT